MPLDYQTGRTPADAFSVAGNVIPNRYNEAQIRHPCFGLDVHRQFTNTKVYRTRFLVDKWNFELKTALGDALEFPQSLDNYGGFLLDGKYRRGQ